MKPLGTAIAASEARRRLAVAGRVVGVDVVALAEAGGRVLAETVRAPEDLPAFARAAMDGFAVRAADVATASEAAPVRLSVVGSVVMGELPGRSVGAGESLAIATGGLLPPGADAVVMVEHTRRGRAGEGTDAGAVEIGSAVAAGRNVVQIGDDFRAGSVVVPAGRRLRAQDVAGLAAFGVTAVSAHRRPTVAVLSTGTEIGRCDEPAPPGKVRDVNQHALAAGIVAAGGLPTFAGIAPDDPAALGAAIAPLIEGHDVVLLSGGSSVGSKDFTAGVLADLHADLMFHGIDVRPGRPTLAATAGDTVLVGLPGVPSAALVIFDVFVRPLLWRLGGERGREPWPARQSARLTRALVSRRGREEYLRVRLEPRADGLWAEPMPGGSGSLSSLVRADGLLVVSEETEQLDAGAPVEICLC